MDHVGIVYWPTEHWSLIKHLLLRKSLGMSLTSNRNGAACRMYVLNVCTVQYLNLKADQLCVRQN